MESTDRLEVLLKSKGSEVASIDAGATVLDALALMAEHDIGALPVMEAGNLVGLVSERDYARKIMLLGRTSRETLVREIMSAPPITVSPQATIDKAMRTMTNERVRHLPVVATDGRMAGLVSIGDLVKWIISSQEQTINHLQAYIAGNI